MDDPATMISPPSSPSEVTWQVAFFALVPLALGTMTQPVGRVFNTAPELRFWFAVFTYLLPWRCTLLFLRVTTDHCLEPTWSWRHFKAELAYRVRDEKWDEEPTKEVEKAALGRWALILLGGIPCQTIKLVGMRGIPWTQTLAIMYFLSLLFGEVLNILAETSFRTPRIAPSLECLPSETNLTCLNVFVAGCNILQVMVISTPRTIPIFPSTEYFGLFTICNGLLTMPAILVFAGFRQDLVREPEPNSSSLVSILSLGLANSAALYVIT
ncbi:uncharacterized protein LY89DRAFT_24540 [Mollisia scopiformis]|uniref:Uncharacterized protein n=1 Tax=Mollisia scopiformis TaxID=149040 RepID=A0A194XWF2_MOLSC|nr:uncharacterized protein LY89DRAFT_24540 [Mollisia scopiformis]KUJ24558.1 hypothetical protein LY89DRAFT_24540 [Mollisia scopiformis]